VIRVSRIAYCVGKAGDEYIAQAIYLTFILYKNMGETLGQHFLEDKTVINDMIAAAEVAAHDSILEIGPGTGMLTEKLLDTGANIIAVEKDMGLIATLQDRFANEIHTGQLTLVSEDIRDVDPSDYTLSASNYKLVANIPYYITGEILRQFLTAEEQPYSITMLVQKEVAERITNATKESVLSLSVKAYGSPTITRTVPARAFSPAPQVDSAILHIGDITRDFFVHNDILEKNFFKFIKAGFQHKRKTLANNLASVGIGKQHVKEILTRARLPKKIRAEDLTLYEWLFVYQTLRT
jgi:16S rRNA (adenine1518-N6/adenine1519-N6)-dimethyltransferase